MWFLREYIDTPYPYPEPSDAIVKQYCYNILNYLICNDVNIYEINQYGFAINNKLKQIKLEFNKPIMYRGTHYIWMNNKKYRCASISDICGEYCVVTQEEYERLEKYGEENNLFVE